MLLRYVYLEDCKHTFESRGLKEWINGKNEEVVVKQCPKCSVPILNTLRFKRYTKLVLNDITEIKKKLIGGSSAATDNAKSILLKSFNSLHQQQLNVRKNICMVFKNDENSKMSDPVAQSRETIYRRFSSFIQQKNSTPRLIERWTSVLKLLETFVAHEERIKKIPDDLMKNEIFDHFDWLLTVASDDVEKLTKQQLIDINLEMVRGTRLISLYETLTNSNYKAAVHQGLKVEYY